MAELGVVAVPRGEGNAMRSPLGFAFFGMLLSVLLILPPTPASAQDEPAYSDAEIDQMLAPIALFPDVLLSQILIASTYPLEVVEAARWRRDRQTLEGEAAVNAAAGQDWDPSVQALVAFPQVLDRMDQDLDWTQRLGEAFLFQEEQVMARVQVLRERAYAAGSLDSQTQLRVSRDDGVIIIEPPSPQLIYVPYYDPRYIYGNWWWPAYQPYYWLPPRGYQIGVGFLWGGGVRLSADFFYSTVHWPNRQVIIVPRYRPYFGRYRSPRDYYSRYEGAQVWRHDMRHRHGLIYRGSDWRTPPRPPAQFGRPPQPQTPQRDSILRGTQGVPVPPRVGGHEQRRQNNPRVVPQPPPPRGVGGPPQERSTIIRQGGSAPPSGQRREIGGEQRGSQGSQQSPQRRQDGGRSSGQRDSILR